MKRFALLCLVVFVIAVSGSAVAQSVKIDSIGQDAGKITVVCTVKPQDKPIDSVHIIGIPTGGGNTFHAKKAITSAGSDPQRVTVKTTVPVGGGVNYRTFAIIYYTSGTESLSFSSPMKAEPFVTAPPDGTNYGKAVFGALRPLGAGKVHVKVEYTKGPVWNAKNVSARTLFLPNGGGPCSIIQTRQVAGRTEWSGDLGRMNVGKHFVFTDVEITDGMGTDKALATDIRRDFEVE